MKNCAVISMNQSVPVKVLKHCAGVRQHLTVTEHTGLQITVISAVKHKQHLKGNIFYQHISWLLASITRSDLRGW